MANIDNVQGLAQMISFRLKFVHEAIGLSLCAGPRQQGAVGSGNWRPRPDLSDWLCGARPIPLHRCTAIEVATQGVVTRKDLRPDDWQSHWPELAQHATQVEEVAHG